MKLKVYTKRTIDNSKMLNESQGKSIIMESADSLYRQLEAACDAHDVGTRYDYLRHIFRQTVNQALLDCQIAFVGFFSKVDFCIKEHDIPRPVANLIQAARKDIFPHPEHATELTDEKLTELFPHNLKATALLVYHLCRKEDIPESLKRHFPKADRQQQWGSYERNVLRAVVEHWDEHFIWATEEENNSTVKVCYDERNTFLTRDGKGNWDYLEKVLWEGAQLNLVRIRTDKTSDCLLPELIILEPDYLINITTIASCFETYAESPYVSLVNKIKPSANSKAIHLGMLAGQLLDDEVHGRDCDFNQQLKDYVSRNVISMISCPELKKREEFQSFTEEAQKQKQNIRKLIGGELPKSIRGFDRKDVVLEPSFFSEILGIQGRLDFLYESEQDMTIVEQKSGKGDFVPFSSPNYHPDIPVAKEQHIVQVLLYRALFIYEFQKYASQLRHTMLLYSKYSKGLLDVGPQPELFLRAIRMRNLLAWSEIKYAKEGVEELLTLTPEMLNMKHTNGLLWDNYTRPQLYDLLAPIKKASTLEQAYFLRFMRFLENEQLLSKVGNKMKEDSGFAAVWNNSLEDKKNAGTIYDGLKIAHYIQEDEQSHSIQGLTLQFGKQQSADTSNFRNGDIVILYSYHETKGREIPNACAQMVHRATITDIKADCIELKLRNSQTDKKVFDAKPEGTLWAIEHDLMDAATTYQYSALHRFLSAPKERRDLLLSQRKPSTDESLDIKGDYGKFNTLVRHAKQARDLFLIIGPPGTGKTSFGLVNLLKEELLEENTNVLLLSYTNRAVDEICSKLVEIREKEDPDFDFIRIGNELSCAKEYRPYMLNVKAAALNSGNEVNQMIQRTRVFCGTTASVNSNSALLGIKHFSLAIIDESSQILEPQLVGLFSAHIEKDLFDAKAGTKCSIDRFVLIGDHKQLPAVVQQTPEESVVTEPELNAIHLHDCRLSLFERLLEEFKTPQGYDSRYVYMLTQQGRMHRDIAQFPNVAFYDNRLDIVPLAHQTLPNEHAASENGIVNILTTRRMAFIASESSKLPPSEKTNSIEAKMIAATVQQIFHLTKETFSTEKTIGVIVPYRNQISLVRNEIDKYGIKPLHDITIDTVERYQGSQRDYIIYGFTIQQTYQLNFLTNNVFEEDGMVIDRKLNVAMTRARLHLIMIGNPQLLKENYTFRKLMEYAREKDCYFEIPAETYIKGGFQVHDTLDPSEYNTSLWCK